MIACVNTDDQAPLPTEEFAFPAEAAAGNPLPTPEGSPEVKRLSFHEPGKPSSPQILSEMFHHDAVHVCVQTIQNLALGSIK